MTKKNQSTHIKIGDLGVQPKKWFLKNVAPTEFDKGLNSHIDLIMYGCLIWLKIMASCRGFQGCYAEAGTSWVMHFAEKRLLVFGLLSILMSQHRCLRQCHHFHGRNYLVCVRL